MATMNPLKARFVIEELINSHGPDCAETGHELVVSENGTPLLIHRGYKWPKGAVTACKMPKAGMKQGFTSQAWDEMGEALSKTINKMEAKCKS